MLWGIGLLVLSALLFVGVCWFTVTTDWSPWAVLPLLLVVGFLCSTSLIAGGNTITPVQGPSAGFQEIDRHLPICVDRKAWCDHAD